MVNNIIKDLVWYLSKRHSLVKNLTLIPIMEMSMVVASIMKKKIIAALYSHIKVATHLPLVVSLDQTFY